MKKLLFLTISMIFTLSLVACDSEEDDDSTSLLALLMLSSSCSVTTTCSASDCTAVTPTYDYTIVDTNQTLCYNPVTGASITCTGTGQDGAYSGNQPDYTSCNCATVVVDNNTGLMWQSTSDTDGVCGLTISDKKTRSEAATYCSDLTYGNYSDWRLPSIKEIYSIYQFSGVDLSGITNATSNGEDVDTTGYEPFINTNYFDIGYGDTSNGERIIDGQYATATLNITRVMSGISETLVDAYFGLNFADGHLKSYETDVTTTNDASYYVRCVRGNTSYGTNSFTDNGDNTISDSATNLMWAKYDSGAAGGVGGAGDADGFEFLAATTYCEGLTLGTGSFDDWRLPNAKELHSILDYTKSPDNDSKAAIDDLFVSTSFTNEAGNTDWGYYWSSSALLNYLGEGDKGAYITFGRGLGYINAIVDVHGAGAQRSDYKTTGGRDDDGVTDWSISGNSCTFGDTAYRKGPQGDIIRAGNIFARCVRDIL